MNDENEFSHFESSYFRHEVVVEDTLYFFGAAAHTDYKIGKNGVIHFNSGTLDFCNFKIEAGGKLDFHGDTNIHNTSIIADGEEYFCISVPNINVSINGIKINTSETGCFDDKDLPVELISLTSEKKEENILIKWSTASEENSAYFGVERSYDQKNWEEISQVKAAGNSQVRVDYSFLDDEIGQVNQVVYHRLRQVDFDGQFTYYGPVAVKMGEQNDAQVTMYPNPVVYAEPLNIVSNFSDMTVKIYDNTGRVFLDRSYNNNYASIPMDYGKGMLMIEVTSGSQKIVEKVIVK